MAKSSDVEVRIPLSEHNDLIRAAGLNVAVHGLSNVKQVLAAMRLLVVAIEDSGGTLSKRELSERVAAIRRMCAVSSDA